MAQIVLGMGTSHGPQLNIPPSEWHLLTAKDQTDARIDYQALLKVAPPDLVNENTPEKWQERYDACHVALQRLEEKLRAAKPDAIVVIGDDQHEQFLDDNMPMFAICYGDSFRIARRERPSAAAWQQAEAGWPAQPMDVPAAPELAGQLIGSLRDQDFDVATSNALKPSVGLGHAFTFLYRYIHPEGTIPMLPVMVNTFFPPNPPTPRRCYALGRALRSAIESWDRDLRVAVVASGGLSHTIIEEDLDHLLLDALAEKDTDALCTLPMERLVRGTSEIRNWVALAGAVEPFDMTLVDYVPCYRSPASTGCAMAFAYWE
ncbi:MAG: hypothetical protein GEU73_00975 [Chloroflexi bacterium]|nr:hypothetical protein [Chloroflexota bacterium]